MFKTDLIVKKELGYRAKYVLLDDLVYESTKYKITVPKGEVTDLTTMFPEGRHTHCSVLHDYCLTSGMGWAYANKVMFDALDDPQLKVRWYIKVVIKTGITLRKWWVRVFG